MQKGLTDRLQPLHGQDFVVEVLLRTKSAAIRGAVDIPHFLEVMENCRQTALHREMELPAEDEFMMVSASRPSNLTV